MKDYKPKIGDSVIFRAFNGDSYSAKVTSVTPDVVRLTYISGARLGALGAPVPIVETVTVKRSDYARLTPFATGAKFMSLETI